jgi:hypothetical protein
MTVRRHALASGGGIFVFGFLSTHFAARTPLAGSRRRPLDLGVCDPPTRGLTGSRHALCAVVLSDFLLLVRGVVVGFERVRLIGKSLSPNDFSC